MAPRDGKGISITLFLTGSMKFSSFLGDLAEGMSAQEVLGPNCLHQCLVVRGRDLILSVFLAGSIKFCIFFKGSKGKKNMEILGWGSGIDPRTPPAKLGTGDLTLSAQGAWSRYR